MIVNRELLRIWLSRDNNSGIETAATMSPIRDESSNIGDQLNNGELQAPTDRPLRKSKL